MKLKDIIKENFKTDEPQNFRNLAYIIAKDLDKKLGSVVCEICR